MVAGTVKFFNAIHSFGVIATLNGPKDVVAHVPAIHLNAI